MPPNRLHVCWPPRKPVAFSAAVRDAVGVASAAPAEVSEAVRTRCQAPPQSRCPRPKGLRRRSNRRPARQEIPPSEPILHASTHLLLIGSCRRGEDITGGHTRRLGRTTISESRNPQALGPRITRGGLSRLAQMSRPTREQGRYRGVPVDGPYATAAVDDVGLAKAQGKFPGAEKGERTMTTISRSMFLLLAAISAVVVLAAGCGGEAGGPADASSSRACGRTSGALGSDRSASSSQDPQARRHPVATTARRQARDPQGRRRHAYRGHESCRATAQAGSGRRGPARHSDRDIRRTDAQHDGAVA